MNQMIIASIQDEDEKLVLSKLQISLMDCPCIWQTYHQKFACDVCVSSWEKTKFVPKNGKSGQQDNKKWWSILSHEHFQTSNPLFEQVNSTFTASITSQLYKSLSFPIPILSKMFKCVQIVRLGQKMSKLCLIWKKQNIFNQVARFSISRFQSCFKTHFLNMMHDNFYEYFVGAEKHEFQN